MRKINYITTGLLLAVPYDDEFINRKIYNRLKQKGDNERYKIIKKKNMTPKERAKELVRKYKGFEMPNEKIAIKQCALITVDIILNDVGAKDWENDSITGNNYWLEVKREIELL